MRNSSSKNAASRAARSISVQRYGTNKNRMASKSVVAADEQTRFPTKFVRVLVARRSFEFAQVPYYQFRNGVTGAGDYVEKLGRKRG
jgi:hypothetical protein